MHWNVESLAQTIKAIELVVDEGLQRTDVQRTNAARRICDDARANWKEGRLGFPACGGCGDDHIPPAIENGTDRFLLDVAQFRPALIPHPPLEVLVKPLESRRRDLARTLLRA